MAKNLAAFCLCPQNLNEPESESNGLFVCWKSFETRGRSDSGSNAVIQIYSARGRDSGKIGRWAAWQGEVFKLP